MKTISEVCRLVGVTRKTLRGYDEIGLLHPTDRSENGYWLYDDDAIRTLNGIQALVEIGYTRREIKELFEKPNVDLNQEYDRAIHILEEKKARIDGMIELAQSMKRAAQFPAAIQCAFQNCNFEDICREQSYSEVLERIISAAGSSDSSEQDETDESWETFTLELLTIGLQKREPADSPLVQDCVNALYKFFISDILAEEAQEFETSEWPSLFEEVIADLTDNEGQSVIDEMNGEGTADFIRSAVRCYCAKLRN